MRYFLQQLRFVKLKDIASLFLFLLAIPPALILKTKRKHLWLICERANEARDNGYWFYKYLLDHRPQQDCVYAIKKTSPDYPKVLALNGEIIEFGTFRHWVYYLAAELNISSQKEGKPNAAACHFLEVYGLIKNKRIYLKHGIVHNDLKWHYYANTKMWLYICSSKKEQAFCKRTFGYPSDSIALTGLCRYDNLNDTLIDKKTIFIMPTRREWLSRPVKDYTKYDYIYDFPRTEYYNAWKKVLEDQTFNKCIIDNKLDVIFFLHPNMQRYSRYFSSLNSQVRIMSSSDIDLQYMLKRAALVITDYSSIAFDVAYMKKPILYYQFDYKKFREGQYQEGYFSYTNDGFGDVCNSSEELICAFSSLVSNNMANPQKYLDRISDFFEFFDSKNCERTYQAIVEKLDKSNLL